MKFPKYTIPQLGILVYIFGICWQVATENINTYLTPEVVKLSQSK